MILYPSRDYRFALKRGMTGTDVAALQLNIGVAVDGIFGKKTKRAVVAAQGALGLTQDGIAGLITQQHLITAGSRPSEGRYGLPEGTLKSIASNESGFAIAAFSPHPSDSGFDLGAFQKSVTPADIGDQDLYMFAYNIKAMAKETASKLRQQYEQFKGKPHVLDSKNFYRKTLSPGNADNYAWMLAVLVHNWPSAAYNLANRGSIFIDASRDTKYAQWVDQASAGRMTTPREWVVSYIARSTTYVQWS